MGYRSVRSRFSFSYYNWICFCFFSPFLFCRVCFAWLPLSSSSLSGCTTRIHFRFTHTHTEREQRQRQIVKKKRKFPTFYLFEVEGDGDPFETTTVLQRGTLPPAVGPVDDVGDGMPVFGVFIVAHLNNSQQIQT